MSAASPNLKLILRRKIPAPCHGRYRSDKLHQRLGKKLVYFICIIVDP